MRNRVKILTACVLALILFLTVPYLFGKAYLIVIHERIQIVEYTGNVSFYKNDEYLGTWHNNMTNIGDDSINARLFNSSWTGSFWNYIAIGTGDGSGTGKTSTALVTETQRALATFYKPADAQWGLNNTFTFTGSSTIKEAGILNAASTGTMAFYVWTLSVAVTSTDTLKICWKGATSGY